MSTKFKFLYVIPNTTLPYGYEFVNILCLPCGFKGRFRFRDKWVSDEFKTNYKSYSGKTIHILLRDRETANFYPLRKAYVESITKIAETYYIKYELGDLFPYDSKTSVRIEQLENYSSGYLKYHTDLKNNTPNNDMLPLVYGSNYEYEFNNNHYDADSNITKELESFQNIVDTIKDISFFKTVTFTKIIHLKQSNSNDFADISNGYYNLKEEMDYELSIYQTAPTITMEDMLTPNDIELKADSKYISIIKGKQRAVGKYDIINFLIRTNINTAGASSFLDVSYKLKPDADQYIDPNLSLPIIIHSRWSKLFWRMLVLLASIIVYLYAYIFKSFKGIPLDILKDISVITTAVVIFDLKNKWIEYIKRK